MLNLETGKYHGLNATAGQMLAALERNASVHSAAVELRDVYPESEIALIEQDLCDLCRSLLERGLIEADEAARS